MTTTDITQQHSSTARRPTSIQHPSQLLQPNSRVASAQTKATSPDQPGALLVSFCTPSKVHRSKTESWFFSRLTKSTHRSSTICPIVNKSSSCGGKHPSRMPNSLIFPRIFCRKRKDSLFSRTILRGRCDNSMVGPSLATHSRTSTIMFKVNYTEILCRIAVRVWNCAPRLIICEINSTHNPTRTNQPTTQR